MSSSNRLYGRLDSDNRYCIVLSVVRLESSKFVMLAQKGRKSSGGAISEPENDPARRRWSQTCLTEDARICVLLSRTALCSYP